MDIVHLVQHFVQQASPQTYYTLQPQDVQSQIYKILKQHFPMNWTCVKLWLWQMNFYHNSQKTEGRERNATSFYCRSLKKKKIAVCSWEYFRIVLTYKTHRKKNDKRNSNNLLSPVVWESQADKGKSIKGRKINLKFGLKKKTDSFGVFLIAQQYIF